MLEQHKRDGFGDSDEEDQFEFVPSPQELESVVQINLYYIRNPNIHRIDGDLTQLGTLRKLDFCGKKSKRGTFSFPTDLLDAVESKKKLRLQKMSLSRITCSLYDAINSIRLKFEDGLQTKEFGRNEDE